MPIPGDPDFDRLMARLGRGECTPEQQVELYHRVLFIQGRSEQLVGILKMVERQIGSTLPLYTGATVQRPQMPPE